MQDNAAALYADRLARVRERMAATHTDLVVVGPSSHMVWLAGLSPHGDERPVLLVVGRERAGLLIPVLNVDSQRGATTLPFYPWADADGPSTAFARLLDDVLGPVPTHAKIALDETMRADFALRVVDALPGAERTFLADTVGVLRARKDAHEYAALKANALINDVAMQAAFAAVRPGVSEREIVDVVRAAHAAHDAGTAFASVCFGANAAYPHHHPGATRFVAGDSVLVDIGSRAQGYPSDMTRVGHDGPPSPEYLAVHAIVERAVQAALAAVRPGVAASSVDRAARDVIAAAGHGAHFVHRTGHGLGIDVHEPPYITATASTLLEEGHVFSIEPGIYLPGRFGIRLEEIVIVRADGAEVLSGLERGTVFRTGG